MTEHNIRVLLVDDDEIDREAVERQIDEMQLPYILQSAASRAEALERLRTSAAQVFSVQSQMSILLKPIIGKPWVLGMHQCSYERNWTEDERSLFKDISLRITDSFSSLLMNRNLRASERELRKSEKKFRAIADYTYDWESWHGIDGQLLWVNRAVERFSDYSIEECLAMSDYPLPLIHEDDRDTIEKVFRQALEEKTSVNDLPFRIWRKDGATLWAAISWQPIYDTTGNYLGLRSSVRDITGRKQAEEALAEYKDHLEAMVAERTRELRASQEKLVHAERLAVMGKFASGIAHEIRNPLGVIDSSVYYLKLLLQDADEETRQQFDRIKLNVTKCTTIIQNLQNLTKMKGPQKVRLDIAAVIADGLAASHVPPSVKVVQQVAAGEFWVDADREQLVMVFRNIVTNAVQAMQNAGTLGVTHGKTEDGGIEVAFEDSGPGIAPENLEKLFQPFFSTKEKGFGVGLPICQMIIEKHGGTLKAQSEAGQGAAFIVRLPIAETEHKGGQGTRMK